MQWTFNVHRETWFGSWWNSHLPSAFFCWLPFSECRKGNVSVGDIMLIHKIWGACLFILIIYVIGNIRGSLLLIFDFSVFSTHTLYESRNNHLFEFKMKASCEVLDLSHDSIVPQVFPERYYGFCWERSTQLRCISYNFYENCREMMEKTKNS